jgi:hypothetical protein
MITRFEFPERVNSISNFFSNAKEKKHGVKKILALN